MDKLYAIKIRQSDGTYGAAIPVSVLAENVDWNSTLSLVDILGQVDTSASIQDQINSLKNTRATQASVNALDQKVDNAVEYITHNSEIADAREGVDGTEYSTLKERLDTEYDILQSQNSSSLIMVNEEPVSATKMVVETSDDQIELALQSDVDEISDTVSSLRSHLLDRKFVLIGDSYGMRNTPNWMSIFQQVLSNNVAYAEAQSSHGFGPSDLSFDNLLTNAINALSSAEREEVTDVVVVGGWNDARWLKQGHVQRDLQNNIFTFLSHVISSFPNAFMTLEFAGWQLGSMPQDSVGIQYFKGARNVYNNTWHARLRHGQSMLKVMLNPTVYDSSGFHPDSEDGANELYYALINDLFGTGTDIYYRQTTITQSDLTFASGVTGTVSQSKAVQIDETARLNLVISGITGYSRGQSLCIINTSKLPYTVWSSKTIIGQILDGPSVYCILTPTGYLSVYGTIPSGSWTLIINDIDTIIHE